MHRIATILRLSITSALLAVATGCPDDPGGSGTGSGSGAGSGSGSGGVTGGSGGSGGTTSTGPSDGAACSEPSGGVQAGFDCSSDEDCCIGAGHPSSAVHPALACPGNRYPNDVECISGQCINHGCNLSGDDCPGDDLTCMTIGGENLCVEPCDTANGDDDCDDNGEADPTQRTYCTGEDDSASNTYCTFSPT